MKIAWLTFILFFPLVVFAAGEEGAAVEDKATETFATEVEITNHDMIRTQGVVGGYQPLTVAGQEIEATFLEETLGEEHGIIVFLHDRGDSFENKTITPLRHRLLQYGWSTLTIALNYPYVPELYIHDPKEVERQQALGKAEKAKDNAEVAKETAKNKEAAWDDEEPEEEQPGAEVSEEEQGESKVEKLPPVSNIERLEAVMSFIQAKEVERIIFIGHGVGGETAVEILDQLTTPIAALVLLGSPKFASDEVWKTFSFPIIDLYGSNDSAAIISAVKHRKKIMKRMGNKNYESRKAVGADHVFYGLQPQLALTLRSWLNKHFVAAEEDEK